MNREDFQRLTLPDQLWLVLEEVRKLKATPAAPSGGGEPPKWDTPISRKGGMVQYASECSAKELSYWIGQYQKPAKDPKYTESNEKTLKSLRYWLSWRQANPSALWTGERNRVQVTAAAPSDKPQQYPRGVTAGPVTNATPTPTFDDEPSGGGDMDDIPFMAAERWG